MFLEASRHTVNGIKHSFVLKIKFNIGMDHSAVVVVHAVQKKQSLYIETRVDEENLTELHRNSNSDKGFV